MITCIFYHALYSVLGGGGDLSVYKRVENAWQLWLDLYSWIE